MRLIGLTAALIGTMMPMLPARADEGALDRVVVVMRHGVRSPTKAPEALADTASDPWPQWPVKPGELTPHGAKAVTLLGADLRRRYAAAGLFKQGGCAAAGDTYVWADSADHRTMESGDALLAGFFPGCNLSAAHAAAGTPDPLFHAANPMCKIDVNLAAAVKAIGDVNALGPDYDKARQALEKIVMPAGCKPGGAVTCPLQGKNTVRTGKNGVALEGPLDVASTLSENLLLEYAEGFSGPQLGWGRLDAGGLSTVMTLHNIYAKAMRETPALAVANSGLLARAVVDAVAGKEEKGFPNEPVPAAAKLVVFVGHDTNLSNLAGIFGLHWDLPGQPDVTAPDTALVFEARKATATLPARVDIAVVYQSLDDLRALTPLTSAHPAGVVPLGIAACGGSCSTQRLGELVAQMQTQACPPADARAGQTAKSGAKRSKQAVP